MKYYRWFNFALILILLTACGPRSGNNGGLFLFGPTPTLPAPQVSITHVPDAQAAMRTFLEAWKIEDYATMYSTLTRAGTDTINQEDFAARYHEAMVTMSANQLDYEILSVLTNPYIAQVAFRVIYHTVLVGDLQRDMVARLSLEDGQWKIQWDDGLILPELRGGNTLAMDYRIPARGDIYDRKGQSIVTQSEAYALGIVPGQIDPNREWMLLSELSKLTGFNPESIRALYEDAAPDWYVPVGEAPASEIDPRFNYLSNLGGLALARYQSRYYANGGIAPQTVGYVISVPVEELDDYRKRGYSGNEKVGYAGLEKWGEEYLAGKHGGALYANGPQGQILTRLAASDPQPADSLYLTIDKNLQLNAQRALESFRGAVVVLERDSGRVLAMASSPGFDPNLFEPNNPNNTLLTTLLNDTQQPLFNRATQGQYPLGSVFKIITFSAALESGLYLPETTYDCQYDFTELTDRVRHDWTWDHCQQELRTTGVCKTGPSGLLTLPEGLMRSCNPFFWHISLDLYSNNRPNDIANMARSFGLGQATGIEQVAEATGQITNPPTAIDVVNQAIGQGDVLVTPLQVATFVAAIGNGGTLYRPQIIEKIQPVDGDPIMVFKPDARATLPLRSDNLKLLQDAMVSVVRNSRGTANWRLRGMQIPVAGKTGTAESSTPGQPHAWFVGYTYANIEGVPDIAIAVVLENAGEGSDYAAPVFRRVAESYFYGSPQWVYPWESTFGVTRTPTPEGGIPTKTPKRKP